MMQSVPHTGQAGIGWPTVARGVFFVLIAIISAGVSGVLVVLGEPYFGFFLLYALVAGLFLGCFVGIVARALSFGNKKVIAATAVLVFLAALVCQDVTAYYVVHSKLAADPRLGRLRLAFPQDDRIQEIVPPDDIEEFVRWRLRNGLRLGEIRLRGIWAWAAWIGDIVMFVAGLGTGVILTTSGRYCRQCKSWYRVILTRPISEKTLQKVAMLAPNQDIVVGPSPVTVGLSICRQFCGPLICQIVCADGREFALELPGDQLPTVLDLLQRESETGLSKESSDHTKHTGDETSLTGTFL